jgi:hypothetical protein
MSLNQGRKQILAADSCQRHGAIYRQRREQLHEWVNAHWSEMSPNQGRKQIRAG